MIAFVLLIPLLVAMLLVSVNRDYGLTKRIAFVGSIASLLLLPFVDSGTTTINWFTINSVQLTITLAITPLSSLLLFMVLLMAPLVFAYSFGFMDLPSEQRRYYLEMLAFETAMLAFAMAGDFILLFIAWEFLSLTSYLLIGFWHSRERAIAAARKSITIILIGDIALLGSMAVLQNAFGTLQFSGIISQVGGGVPAIAIALLIVAVLTKSAQFPFHEWLPDAMEGPTPVSAFLHSSTMVKAGVFATIVLFPLFSAAKGLGLDLLLAVGVVTVILSTLNAVREKQIKKVLAYSTVQELGLMFIAVSSNALLAAVYFFFAQSFYKALLFFSAGISMKANDKEDLEELGLRQNRIIYITTLFGVLALAGFLPFDGFFANVGLATFSPNLIIYLLISFTSLGTSFYAFRWLFLQEKKPRNAKISLSYKSTPKVMSYVMLVLAFLVLAASAGFFLIPSELSSISQFQPNTGLNVGITDAVVETAVVAVGAFVAYRTYKQKKPKALAESQKTSVWGLAYTPKILNASYAHIAEFVEVLAGAALYFEENLNNLFDWFGHLVIRTGSFARRVAVGEINVYVALFAVGLLLLIIFAVI